MGPGLPSVLAAGSQEGAEVIVRTLLLVPERGTAFRPLVVGLREHHARDARLEERRQIAVELLERLGPHVEAPPERLRRGVPAAAQQRERLEEVRERVEARRLLKMVYHHAIDR